MAVELPEGWREALPENIRENGALDGIDTIDKMAELIVQGRARDSNSIPIPGADASDDKKQAFLDTLQEKVPDLVYVGEGAEMDKIYDRMGRPEAHTGYELGEVPDGMKDGLAKITEAAFKAGLSKNQMKDLGTVMIDGYNESKGVQTAALEKNRTAVKTEYGEQTEAKLRDLEDFGKQLGFDEGLVGAISDGSIGVDNIKALDTIKAGYKSSGPRIGDNQDTLEFDHLTPGQAEEQIAEILNNKEHAYWHGAAPGHKAAVEKMTDLVRAAEAGKPQSETDKFRDALQGRS